jgi:hypothetical protein
MPRKLPAEPLSAVKARGGAWPGDWQPSHPATPTPYPDAEPVAVRLMRKPARRDIFFLPDASVTQSKHNNFSQNQLLGSGEFRDLEI